MPSTLPGMVHWFKFVVTLDESTYLSIPSVALKFGVFIFASQGIDEWWLAQIWCLFLIWGNGWVGELLWVTSASKVPHTSELLHIIFHWCYIIDFFIFAYIHIWVFVLFGGSLTHIQSIKKTLYNKNKISFYLHSFHFTPHQQSLLIVQMVLLYCF